MTTATSLRLFTMALMLSVVPIATLHAQGSSQPSASTPSQQQLKPEQLEQLVAPIALYPDNLLSQVLIASTYPLEVVQADRWVEAEQESEGR